MSKIKIAVASDGQLVTGHFGHCEQFHIFLVEAGQITQVESIKNPGHKPGFLPVFLHDQEVNTIISGGMGSGAVEIFNEKGIEVVVGASGLAENVVKSFIAGELRSTGTICTDHSHDHNHGHGHGHAHGMGGVGNGMGQGSGLGLGHGNRNGNKLK